jgi:hypothetical protein
MFFNLHPPNENQLNFLLFKHLYLLVSIVQRRACRGFLFVVQCLQYFNLWYLYIYELGVISLLSNPMPLLHVKQGWDFLIVMVWCFQYSYTSKKKFKVRFYVTCFKTHPLSPCGTWIPMSHGQELQQKDL